MLTDIRCIEIEIHSFCNRKCRWCPNAEIDRTKKIDLEENIYLSILYELEAIDYKNTISYSRYNEPMADIRLFKKRVQQARDMLPEARLVSNTNGDFLSKKNLKGLKLDELTVMDYDNRGIVYCQRRMEALGINITSIDYPYIHGILDSMVILYYVDWTLNEKIVDRGGLIIENDEHLKWLHCKEKRDRPCFEPKFFVGVDYTGHITPCCQIRSDEDAHKPYVLGYLKENTLNDILTKYLAKTFRLCTSEGKFEGIFPCQYCQKEPGRYTRTHSGIDYSNYGTVIMNKY